MVTGEPVAGNHISIVEIFNVSDGVSGSKTKDFYSGQTNSEGVLFITEKFNKNRRYTVKVGKFTEDVCYINKSNENWYVGANTEINFEYAPCAYSKLIINNVNCQGTDDQFVLFRQDEIGSLAQGSQGWEHLGCTYWETNGFSDIPMGRRFYRWEVTRSGITTIYHDTVYYPPGEYITYEINY